MAYSTLVDADAYFLNRLHVSSWTTASDADKVKGLAEASSRIDRLKFKGDKVDVDQVLEFPRYYGDESDGTETIPDDIKNASYEIALALLDGVDLEIEAANLAVTNQAFASVRTSYDREDVPPYLANGIPSAYAWQYLKPFLVAPGGIKFYRVS